MFLSFWQKKKILLELTFLISRFLVKVRFLSCQRSAPSRFNTVPPPKNTAYFTVFETRQSPLSLANLATEHSATITLWLDIQKWCVPLGSSHRDIRCLPKAACVQDVLHALLICEQCCVYVSVCFSICAKNTSCFTFMDAHPAGVAPLRKPEFPVSEFVLVSF